MRPRFLSRDVSIFKLLTDYSLAVRQPLGAQRVVAGLQVQAWGQAMATSSGQLVKYQKSCKRQCGAGWGGGATVTKTLFRTGLDSVMGELGGLTTPPCTLGTRLKASAGPPALGGSPPFLSGSPSLSMHEQGTESWVPVQVALTQEGWQVGPECWSPGRVLWTQTAA